MAWRNLSDAPLHLGCRAWCSKPRRTLGDVSRPDGAYHPPPLDPLAVEPRETTANSLSPAAAALPRVTRHSQPRGIITSTMLLPVTQFLRTPRCRSPVIRLTTFRKLAKYLMSMSIRSNEMSHSYRCTGRLGACDRATDGLDPWRR